MNIMDKILVKKKERLSAQKQRIPVEELKEKLSPIPRRAFQKAIHVQGQVSLIAELKKASPSKGIIREDFSPEGIARIYQQAGARAISVLTEEDFFQGDLYHLPLIRQEVHLPLLRKDFIFEEYQIYESEVFGADALLLITRILQEEELERLITLTYELGMEALLEVYDQKDLSRALSCNPRIIGINNRNLEDFGVDIENTLRLRDRIPPHITVVSESGINSVEDVLLLKKADIHAVLVGQALLESSDIETKIRAMGLL